MKHNRLCWRLRQYFYNLRHGTSTSNIEPSTSNILGMSINIRFADTDDASMLADLSRRTFYDTFASVNSPENMEKFMNEQFTRTRLMEEVGAPSNIFIIAEVGNELAGYARLRESGDPPVVEGLPSIEIARIYAVQSMLGKGVGNALMKKCIEIAYDMGKRVIWLGVWEKNLRAIQFYIKWGFEKFDEHDFVLGDDVQRDWLMKKMLEDQDTKTNK